jgi:hypothetical protein
VGFASSKQCRKKQNVENYKKLDKQLKHELFRDKVRLVTVYEKFPQAFLLLNSVIEEIAEMKGYSRLGLGLG